jgi:hypothetical protein
MSDIRQEPVNHTYGTRNKSNLVRFPKHSTVNYEKSVSYSGLSLYNLLSQYVKDLKKALIV